MELPEAKKEIIERINVGSSATAEWANAFALRAIAFAVLYGLYAVAEAIKTKKL